MKVIYFNVKNVLKWSVSVKISGKQSGLQPIRIPSLSRKTLNDVRNNKNNSTFILVVLVNADWTGYYKLWSLFWLHSVVHVAFSITLRGLTHPWWTLISISITLSLAYSSQGSHTGQLHFCNWLAGGSTTGSRD